MKNATVHFLRLNKRTTACGRRAKKTARDTRDTSKVTCGTCRRVVAIWLKRCSEVYEE